MGVELRVPALGESITEATVGKWHKQVGETVAVDEPVVVLETDKVAVDVPAPAPTPPHPPPPPARQPPAGQSPPMTPVAKRVAEERGLDVMQIKGTGPGGKILKEDVLGYVEARGQPEPVPAPAPTPIQ